VAVDGTATIHACLSCRGIFVPPRAWCAAAARPELASAIAARFPERPFAPSARIPLVRCPVCACELDRGRFAATAPVVVDVCPRHHGVWLDAGELGGIASFAKLRAAVGPEEARRTIERAEHRASFELERTKLELEAAAAQARIQVSPRFQTAKRSGLAVVAALLVARVLFGLHCGRSAAPELGKSQRAAERTESMLGP
jgi:Zn-finger nucleic acid-binding protein